MPASDGQSNWAVAADEEYMYDLYQAIFGGRLRVRPESPYPSYDKLEPAFHDHNYPQAGEAGSGVLYVDATGRAPVGATTSASSRDPSPWTPLTPLEQLSASSFSPPSQVSSPSLPPDTLLPSAHASPASRLGLSPSAFILQQQPSVPQLHHHAQAANMGYEAAGPYELPTLPPLPPHMCPQGGQADSGSASGSAGTDMAPLARTAAEPCTEVGGPGKGKAAAEGQVGLTVAQMAQVTATAQAKKGRIPGFKARAQCGIHGCTETVDGTKCTWGNHFKDKHKALCEYMGKDGKRRWRCRWKGCADKTFKTPAKLGDHTLVKHLDQGFMCRVCEKRLTSAYALKRHLREEHGIVLWENEDAGPSM